MSCPFHCPKQIVSLPMYPLHLCHPGHHVSCLRPHGKTQEARSSAGNGTLADDLLHELSIGRADPPPACLSSASQCCSIVVRGNSAQTWPFIDAPLARVKKSPVDDDELVCTHRIRWVRLFERDAGRSGAHGLRDACAVVSVASTRPWPLQQYT